GRRFRGTRAGRAHGVKDIPPVTLGALLRPFGPDDDLLVTGDMPFLSYQAGTDAAVLNGGRLDQLGKWTARLGTAAHTQQVLVTDLRRGAGPAFRCGLVVRPVETQGAGSTLRSDLRAPAGCRPCP